MIQKKIIENKQRNTIKWPGCYKRDNEQLIKKCKININYEHIRFAKARQGADILRIVNPLTQRDKIKIKYNLIMNFMF